MPTVLRKYGYRFHFFTGEPPGQRPHIHVDGNGAVSKSWLDDCSLVWERGFNTRELARVTEVVLENRDLFLTAWSEIHG